VHEAERSCNRDSSKLDGSSMANRMHDGRSCSNAPSSIIIDSRGREMKDKPTFPALAGVTPTSHVYLGIASLSQLDLATVSTCDVRTLPHTPASRASRCASVA
jgi:hypothetical protein